MVHINTMLLPIDVFVYWEYDKHRETSHTSLFKPINYFLRPISPAEVPDLGFIRCLIGQGRCPMSLVRCPIGQAWCPISLRRCLISILIDHLACLIEHLACPIGHLARPIGHFPWPIGHLIWPIGHLTNPRSGTSAGLIGHLAAPIPFFFEGKTWFLAFNYLVKKKGLNQTCLCAKMQLLEVHRIISEPSL